MTRATQQPRGVTLLGSTGSIGLSTLDVIARHPQRYRVVALTANTQGERLFEQCLQYRPEMAVLLDPAAAEELRAKLRAVGLTTQVLSGLEGLTTVATLPEAPLLLAAIGRAAGLLPTPPPLPP